MVRDQSVELEPALAILEIASIARGYVVLDAACKRAVVRVVRAEPVSPGKFWIALAGGEAETDEALRAGIDAAAESRIDHTHLPGVHNGVLSAVESGVARVADVESVGALELSSIASTVRAADACMKAAAVRLAGMHLARGIGGKGYVIVTGRLPDVISAIAAGEETAGAAWVVGREIIANPDGDAARAVGNRRDV